MNIPVLILAGRPPVRQALERVLGELGVRYRSCPLLEQALAPIEADGAMVLLTERVDARGASVLPLLKRLRVTAPDTYVVLLLERPPAGGRVPAPLRDLGVREIVAVDALSGSADRHLRESVDSAVTEVTTAVLRWPIGTWPARRPPPVGR